MENKLQKRSEVLEELTWDLSLLYRTEEEMYQDVEKMKQLGNELEENYKGKLNEAITIAKCIEKYAKLLEITTLVVHYVELAAEVDHTDAHLQERFGNVMKVYTKINSQLSFIKSEILEQPEELIKEAAGMTKIGKLYLEDILREKPYKLSPETEKAMAALSQTFETPYNVYNAAKLADMKFDSFEVDGKEYPLGYSLFEDNYEYEACTKVRRKAFEAFSEKIRQYENVTATAYNACVQHEKVMADLRGFDSVFESLLFPQKVDLAMYNRQIDLITEKLAPHMRKYAKVIQKIYGLEKMTFADLKLPLDPEYDPKVTIEESKEYIEKGLSILGEDYVEMIRTAYQQRWVDFAKNEGKCTGGFCASPYGKNSYILLSWNDRMSDVFTLAHELGHAGHFKACNAAQSIFDTDVSTYFVESPSTMNELLMAHYLLKTSEDKRFRRWVLSCMVSNTYYHNFVTHLLEAAYQREVYRIVDAGGSVQAETLNRIKRKVLEDFWQDTVEITKGAELTWMRQPHYYMGMYSYTYSAGLTIATEVCDRIEREGQPAVEDWKRVLRAGGTKTPMELAKMAGVDISTDEPLLHTIETIGNMIDEICRLTEELEAE